jgi:hypothetical protein
MADHRRLGGRLAGLIGTTAAVHAATIDDRGDQLLDVPPAHSAVVVVHKLFGRRR